MALIEKSISGQTALPETMAWFPKEYLAGENSVRLIPQSVLELRVLKSGYVGQYDFGKGVLVEESTKLSANIKQ